MEKSKTSVVGKTSDRRATLSEIWDERVVFSYIWGTFGLLTYKVILRSFGALAIFPKNTTSPQKKKNYFFYKSQPKFIKLSMNHPLNGLHKTAFGIFEILKF